MSDVLLSIGLIALLIMGGAVFVAGEIALVSLRESHEGWARLADIGLHLILPAAALSLRFLAMTARMARASMLEALGRDYVRTAQAKGASALRVLCAHALPNAALPVLTLVGYNLGFVLAGSALVETVFGWPGMGRLLYDSVFARDFPVLLGIMIVVSLTVVLANLATDLLYAYFDPRIRYRA